MPLEEKLALIREKIAAAAHEAGREMSEITIEAATKTQTSETIRAAIACGISVCGENRVQELTAHLANYAYDGARVHFIGHLQTNKVKQVVGRVDLIESVDSLRLLEAINAQAGKLDIVQDILLEVNIGAEPQKGGVLPVEVPSLALAAAELPHVCLRGLMAVPPPAALSGGNRHFFARTRQLFVDIRTLMGDNETDIACLSMGMSGDYEDAVREGATLVRVGSALFGSRPPMNGTPSQA
ncbi:conserved hypothetical protein [uncultured Eubacteriales bacterium]|uniref:Pyridoxal phosphate homeostasis protein n=1 Tax=uncultured Eubacteriales bacterium TaxID=172733 RepID=A0A212KIJ1_9FIRM|nr:conserved hypothetical protein [uncultured Eubacteriales bacterium]